MREKPADDALARSEQIENAIRERLKRGEDPLNLSIKKWEGVVKKFEGGAHLHDLFLGCNHCPLCLGPGKYDDVKRDIPLCRRCPIGKITKQDLCDGTPYQEFESAEADDSEALAKVARQELRFLRAIKRGKGKEWLATWKANRRADEEEELERDEL